MTTVRQVRTRQQWCLPTMHYLLLFLLQQSMLPGPNTTLTQAFSYSLAHRRNGICLGGKLKAGITTLFARPKRKNSPRDPSKTSHGNEGTQQEELWKLSKQVGVRVPRLVQMLQQQRQHLKDDSERASYINWLLSEADTFDYSESKNIEHKNPTSKTEIAPSQQHLLENDGHQRGERGKEEAPGTSTPRRTRVRPRRSSYVKARKQADQAELQARYEESLKDPTLLSNVQFEERDDLHPNTKRAITNVLGLNSMTEIQAKTYAAAISGRNVLGRARTGTGKTLAFLLPSVERMLSSSAQKQFRVGTSIGMLIISPTRELAVQIAEVAENLTTYHQNELSVMCLYGGTSMARDVNMLKKNLPSILVATPGRLQDHIDGTRIGPHRFSSLLGETSIVVLDETDRLLDMGFQREIENILSFLPRREKRQTLLFSATVPGKLRPVIKKIVGDDYFEMNCVNQADETSETNARVDQYYHVMPSIADDYLVTLVQVVKRAMNKEQNYKILVFFPATKLVSLFSDVFSKYLAISVVELHSKMSQGSRSRASAEFRKAKRAVMFTSDVTARGVDYPDVTEVIQFGAPDSVEHYIHRLGRTGRAGKSGRGVIILLPFERSFAGILKRRGVLTDAQLNSTTTDTKLEYRTALTPVLANVKSNPVLNKKAQGAYLAFLGYYLDQMPRWQIEGNKNLVKYANEFSCTCGLSELPELEEKTASKLRLTGVPGIQIAESHEN